MPFSTDSVKSLRKTQDLTVSNVYCCLMENIIVNNVIVAKKTLLQSNFRTIIDLAFLCFGLLFRWYKFTLKPPYSIASENFFSAIGTLPIGIPLSNFERSRLASKSCETGELSYDSLNLTGSISRHNTKDGRTRSSHPGWVEGTT